MADLEDPNELTDEEREYYDQLALAIANRDIQAVPEKGGWKFLKSGVKAGTTPPPPPPDEPVIPGADTPSNPRPLTEVPNFNREENYQDNPVFEDGSQRPQLVPGSQLSGAAPWPSYNAKEVPNPDDWMSQQEQLEVAQQPDGKTYTLAGREDIRSGTQGTLRGKLEGAPQLQDIAKQNGVVETVVHDEDTSSPFKLGWRAFDEKVPFGVGDFMEKNIKPVVSEFAEAGFKTLFPVLQPLIQTTKLATGVDVNEAVGNLAAGFITPVSIGDFALLAAPKFGDLSDYAALTKFALKGGKPLVTKLEKAANAVEYAKRLWADNVRANAMGVRRWVNQQDNVIGDFLHGGDPKTTEVVPIAVRRDALVAADEDSLAASRGAMRVSDPTGVRIMGPGDALQEGEELFYHGGRIVGDIQEGMFLTPDLDDAATYAGVTSRLNKLDQFTPQEYIDDLKGKPWTDNKGTFGNYPPEVQDLSEANRLINKGASGDYGDAAKSATSPDEIHNGLKAEAAERLDFLNQLRQAGASQAEIDQASIEYLRSLSDLNKFYDDSVEYMNAGFNPIPVVHAALKQTLALAESMLPKYGVDGVVYHASTPFSVNLLGVGPVNPHLKMSEKVLNIVRWNTGTQGRRVLGVLAHPLTARIIDEHRKVMMHVDSRAAMSTAESLSWLFVGRNGNPAPFITDKSGLITDGALKGLTIQDVAARFVSYKPLMTPDQKLALQRVHEAIHPYLKAQEEQGIDVATRWDIEPGGFYLPRGSRDEDALKAVQYEETVRPTRRSPSVQQQQRAKWPSMHEGIANGEVYKPMEEALNAYFVDVGRQIADAHFANIMKNATDENGVLLHNTAAGRLLAQNGTIKAQVESLRGQIRSLMNSIEGMHDDHVKVLTDFLNNPAPDMDAVAYAMRNVFAAGGKLRFNPIGKRSAFYKDAVKGIDVMADGLRYAVHNLWDSKGKPRFRTEKDMLDRLIKGLDKGDPYIDEMRYAVRNLFNPDGSLRKQVRINGKNVPIGPDDIKLSGKELHQAGSGLRRLQGVVETVMTLSAALDEEAGIISEESKAIRQASSLLSSMQEKLKGISDYELGWAAEQDAIDASLKELHQGLRTEVFVTSGTYKGMTREQKTKAILKNKAGNIGVKHGQFKGLNLEDAEQQLKFVKDQLDQLEPRWLQAKADALKVPEGSLDIEARRLGTHLNGYAFPDLIASQLNHYLLRDDPGLWTSINGLLRGMRSTLDISYVGNQGLFGMYDNLPQHVHAVGLSLKAMANNNALGTYVRSFNEAARLNNTPSAQDWAAAGLHFGGVTSEFQMSLGGRLTAPFNQAFGAFGDIRRLDGAAGDLKLQLERGLAPGATPQSIMKEIAAAHNGMTGWSPNKVGGELGQTLLFAPRFYMAQFENIVRGFNPANWRTFGGEGAKADIARRSLLRLTGGGITMTAALNYLAGNEVGGDFNWWSPTINGKINPNFMRVRALGLDISLFGYVDSLLFGLIGAVNGDPAFIARSKANPLIALSLDIVLGTNAIGEKVSVESIARSFLPFSIQKAPIPGLSKLPGEVKTDSLGKSIAGPTGFKASAVSVTEEWVQLEKDMMRELVADGTVPPEVAEAFTNADPQALSASEKKLIDRRIAEKYPEKSEGYKEYRRERESVFQSLSDEADAARVVTKEKYDALQTKLLNGGNQREVWDAYDKERDRLSGKLEQIYNGTSKNSKEFQEAINEMRPNDVRRVEAEYDDIVNANTKAGTVDWDKVQKQQLEFIVNLAQANRPLANRLAHSLELREKFNYEDAHPLTQIKKEASKQLRPYYELKDKIEAGSYRSLDELKTAEKQLDNWLINNPSADVYRWLTAKTDTPTLHSIAALERALQVAPDNHIRLPNSSLDITEKNLPILKQYEEQIMRFSIMPSTAIDPRTQREYNPRTTIRQNDPLYDALYFWLGFDDEGKVYNLAAVQRYIQQWGPRSDGVKPVQVRR